MSDTESTTTTIQKSNSRVEYYRDRSTIDRANVVMLKVEAPITGEAEALFTKKIEELNIKNEIRETR